MVDGLTWQRLVEREYHKGIDAGLWRSQAGMARWLNLNGMPTIPQQVISKWINGQSRADDENMRLFTAALRLDAQEVVMAAHNLPATGDTAAKAEDDDPPCKEGWTWEQAKGLLTQGYTVAQAAAKSGAPVARLRREAERMTPAPTPRQAGGRPRSRRGVTPTPVKAPPRRQAMAPVADVDRTVALSADVETARRLLAAVGLDPEAVAAAMAPAAEPPPESPIPADVVERFAAIAAGSPVDDAVARLAWEETVDAYERAMSRSARLRQATADVFSHAD